MIVVYGILRFARLRPVACNPKHYRFDQLPTVTSKSGAWVSYALGVQRTVRQEDVFFCFMP